MCECVCFSGSGIVVKVPLGVECTYLYPYIYLPWALFYFIRSVWRRWCVETWFTLGRLCSELLKRGNWSKSSPSTHSTPNFRYELEFNSMLSLNSKTYFHPTNSTKYLKSLFLSLQLQIESDLNCVDTCTRTHHTPYTYLNIYIHKTLKYFIQSFVLGLALNYF